MHEINLALATSGNLILAVALLLHIMVNNKMNKLQNKKIDKLERIQMDLVAHDSELEEKLEKLKSELDQYTTIFTGHVGGEHLYDPSLVYYRDYPLRYISDNSLVPLDKYPEELKPRRKDE